MEPLLDRRNLLGLASVGIAAAVASEDTAEAQFGQGLAAAPAVHGDWLNVANNGICGILQAGAVLLLVNENGDMATAQIQGNRVSVMRGWNAVNLVGLITNNARVLRFNNGSEWQKT
jgi:hypothetical protein